MRKKLMAMVVAMFAAVTANAQFEEDKVYVGGSLTGFNMKYTGSEKFSIAHRLRLVISLPTTFCFSDSSTMITLAKRKLQISSRLVSVVATTLSRTAYILA